MKSLLVSICVVVCLVLSPLLLSGSSSSAFAASPASQTAFVDLDGDGFNDAADDTDGDGIPDDVENTTKPKIVTVAQPGAAFFAELTAETEFENHLSAAERFKLRENAARDITGCRSDLVSRFDADGGPGTSLSGGGGHCVGGICF